MAAVTEAMAPAVIEYLAQHHIMTLATASFTGLPEASTVAYATDDRSIYFTLESTSIARGNLAMNRWMSFTIDDFASDWKKTRGLRGTGEGEPVRDPLEIDHAHAHLADKFGGTEADLADEVYRISPTAIQFIDYEYTPSGVGDSGIAGTNVIYQVFRELPLGDTEQVVMHLMPAKADVGDVLIRQGAEADRFLIVVDGAVEVRREGHGADQVVATLGPGQFFGEASLLRRGRSTASVQAVLPTSLLAMNRDAFRELVGRAVGLHEDFESLVRQRLLDSDR